MDKFYNPAGAVMEPNQFLDMAAFKKLEKMPTKIEMIATIARLLNQVRNIDFSRACVHESVSSFALLHYSITAAINSVLYYQTPGNFSAQCVLFSQLCLLTLLMSHQDRNCHRFIDCTCLVLQKMESQS